MKRIAIAQITSTSNPLVNFQTIERFTYKAVENKASLICFPENFNFMGKPGEGAFKSQSIDGEYMERYKNLARSAGIWMSLGGFQESSADPNKSYNTHIILSDQGEIKALYRKIHLFDVNLKDRPSIQESKTTLPGDNITEVVDTPVGKLGLSICYDLRFPELYRSLSLKGAEILLVPAAFLEKTGYAHWEVLLRARAIENGCYVLASAQDGVHESGRVSYGHSCAIDPWGTVIATASEGPGLVYADIDLELLHSIRGRIPTLKHIKLIPKL
jgi:deaminated glutathione amidase